MQTAEHEAEVRRQAHEELDRALNMLLSGQVAGYRIKQQVNRGRVTHPIIDVTLRLDRVG